LLAGECTRWRDRNEGRQHEGIAPAPPAVPTPRTPPLTAHSLPGAAVVGLGGRQPLDDHRDPHRRCLKTRGGEAEPRRLRDQRSTASRGRSGFWGGPAAEVLSCLPGSDLRCGPPGQRRPRRLAVRPGALLLPAVPLDAKPPPAEVRAGRLPVPTAILLASRVVPLASTLPCTRMNLPTLTSAGKPVAPLVR